MSKGGRPTKLNDEVQHKIVTAIKQGNYIETASAYAGINKSTLYEWLKRGEREKQRVAKDGRLRIRKKEQKFVEFSNEIERALAESEMRDVLVIGKAAERQWQAAAWRLERKFPSRWGRKQSISELDIEEQKARIAQIKASTDKITGEGKDIEDLSEVYGDIYDD